MKLVFKTLALLWSTKFLNISFTSKFLKTHKAFESRLKICWHHFGYKKDAFILSFSVRRAMRKTDRKYSNKTQFISSKEMCKRRRIDIVFNRYTKGSSPPRDDYGKML